jgi:hypothetical protein
LTKQAAIFAGLLLLGLGAVGPAMAQSIYVAPNAALPPYAVIRVVTLHGLTPLTRPVRRGPNYVLLATDRTGQEMQVTVDARLGDIVSLRQGTGGGPYGPQIAVAPPAARASADPLTPAPNRGPRPAADLAPPPRPVPNPPNPRVGANAPNPNVAPTPPPPPAPPASRPAAVEPPGLPPLPPPPPLPRPRPKLAAAQGPVEAPDAPPPVAAKPPVLPVPHAAPPAKEAAGQIE